MIVRTHDAVVHLIAQPDHAALARRVMERWAPLHDAERRGSILLAVEEHDNGWQEPDAAPIVNPETGQIFDFVTIPAQIRQDVWPRGVGRLAEDAPWAAALVAHHAVTVYERYRSDPAWQHFFPRLEHLRETLVVTSRGSAAQLTHDYSFVRIGDLISLVFCAAWDEPQTFGEWTFRRDGDRVLVSPDPFNGRVVPLTINARQIPARRYRDDEDLQRTVRSAPIVRLSGTVSASDAR